MIHGFCASKYVFAKQFVSAILSTCRLISFDLRGHGESDKPSEANFYTEGHRWADDVKAVIDHLGIHRPILAGWFLGGHVISQYVAVHGADEIAGINFVSSRNAIDPQRDVLGPASHFFKTMDTDDLLENIERTSQFVERSYAMPMSEKDIRFPGILDRAMRRGKGRKSLFVANNGGPKGRGPDPRATRDVHPDAFYEVKARIGA
ncbi:alpha/beta fold hydrolase [Tardiphaga sp. 803_E3_N1_3]|uniref:alpha/beta fold hydrolase n=1 Tax=Tardiphaga sp. 803_E3_N1_3 TaxID=3240785 RepID=UPI003F234F9F